MYRITAPEISAPVLFSMPAKCALEFTSQSSGPSCECNMSTPPKSSPSSLTASSARCFSSSPGTYPSALPPLAMLALKSRSLLRRMAPITSPPTTYMRTSRPKLSLTACCIIMGVASWERIISAACSSVSARYTCLPKEPRHSLIISGRPRYSAALFKKAISP